jgi:superfamily II DNA/RNA helicase
LFLFLFFFETETQQGINFDTYEKIPVEMSGEDYPDPAESFEESGLCEELLANVNRCKFLKPTPVQKYSIPVILDSR